MALSGSFHNYPVSNFGLYCEWTGTQNIQENYTAVTLNVYLSYYTLECGSRTGAVGINQTTASMPTSAIYDYSAGWKKRLLKTYTVNVPHNADGTKSGVLLEAQWPFNGTYSSVYVGTIYASATVTLNTIDRTVPTVALSTSGVTTTSVNIGVTSSAQANLWQYSLNNGSTWTTFSTQTATTGGYTITGLSPNTTYNLKARVRKASNNVYGTSSTVTVKTVGASQLLGVDGGITADAATVTLRLNTSVYNPAYTHTLMIWDGQTSIVSITGISWTSGTYIREITLTASQRTALLSHMSNKKQFTATVYLKTYSGSTQIGYDSHVTCIARTTAANSHPIANPFTYSDSNSTTYGVTGDRQTIIQNLSSVTLTAQAAQARNGASITRYTFTCNGKSVSATGTTVNFGAIEKSGDQEMVLTVTDSRGYTATCKTTIPVIPYAIPKISSITTRRRNLVEETIQLIFNGIFSTIKVGGVEKNHLSRVRYRYKLTSDTSYGAYTAITSAVTQTGNSFSYSNLELCTLDDESSYDFHIEIDDAFGSVTKLDITTVIPQGIPALSLRKNKVGINVREPQATLHVGGNVMIGSDPVADFVIVQGSNATWQWRKWASGRAELWGTLSKQNIAVTTQWGSLFCSGNITNSKAYFPFELTGTPTVQFSADAYNGGVILARGGNCEPATAEHTGTLEAFRGASGTVGIKFYYYVCGFWK